MDDRKLKILSAVVNEYIVTGEPVGSKAIMAHVKASSATIRNEMAELEKPRLSRTATHLRRVAYQHIRASRLYVDQLMEQNQLTANEKKMLDSMVRAGICQQREDLVNEASMALARSCPEMCGGGRKRNAKVLAYLKGRGNTYRKENVRYFDDNVQRLY